MDDRASSKSIKLTTHKKNCTIIYLSNGVTLMVRLDKTCARTYAYISLFATQLLAQFDRSV